MGTCGYTCSEILDLTYRDYLHKLQGHVRAEEQKWALARWHVWRLYLLSPYIESNRKPRTPLELFLLPSESPQKCVDMRTPEERNEVREFFKSKGWEIIN